MTVRRSSLRANSVTSVHDSVFPSHAANVSLRAGPLQAGPISAGARLRCHSPPGRARQPRSTPRGGVGRVARNAPIGALLNFGGRKCSGYRRSLAHLKRGKSSSGSYGAWEPLPRFSRPKLSRLSETCPRSVGTRMASAVAMSCTLSALTRVAARRSRNKSTVDPIGGHVPLAAIAPDAAALCSSIHSCPSCSSK
jgi:hypothetical protein